MQLLSFPHISARRRKMLTHTLPPRTDTQRVPQHIPAARGAHRAPTRIITTSAAAAPAPEKKNIPQALIFL